MLCRPVLHLFISIQAVVEHCVKNKGDPNLNKNFSNSDPSTPARQTMTGIFSIPAAKFGLSSYFPASNDCKAYKEFGAVLY